MSERDDAALLRLLGEHDVRFVVIGGWAVITHGYIRFTKDVDVLIADSPEQRRAVARAMASVEASRLDGQSIEADSDTPIANSTGQPSISLPLGATEDGLPAGVMLTAQTLREDVLLQVAAQLEHAMPWIDRRPKVSAE